MKYEELKAKWEKEKIKHTAWLAERGIEYPRCGFSIGKGWEPLVYETLEKMVAAGWDKNLSQVKQKFCVLCIYTGYTNDSPEVRAIIKAAVDASATMCESCGGPHLKQTPMAGSAMCDDCKNIFTYD